MMMNIQKLEQAILDLERVLAELVKILEESGWQRAIPRERVPERTTTYDPSLNSPGETPHLSKRLSRLRPASYINAGSAALVRSSKGISAPASRSSILCMTAHRHYSLAAT
jgi:hypothetical protein